MFSTPPPAWRGRAFGAKFVLTLGVSSLGVSLVPLIHRMTGSLDGLLRGVLDGRHHEISHGAPLELRGALEHGMQVGADPGFKTGGRDGCGHGAVLL